MVLDRNTEVQVLAKVPEKFFDEFEFDKVAEFLDVII